MKIRIYIRIVHPSFAPIFHPTFLSVRHAGKASMVGSVSGSLTILRLQSATSLPQSCQDRSRFFLTGQCAMRPIAAEEYKKKGGRMPLFTIMHIYEVPARNQYEATNELMTARKHHFDKVYLKKVLVKDAEELTPFRHKVNVFAEPKKPAKWGTIFRRQLVGK